MHLIEEVQSWQTWREPHIFFKVFKKYKTDCFVIFLIQFWSNEVKRVWKDLRMTVCGYFGPSHSPCVLLRCEEGLWKGSVRSKGYAKLHIGCIAIVQFKFVLEGSFWYQCAPDTIMEGLPYQRLVRWCISKWKISIVIHIMKSTNPIIMAQLLHPVTVWKTGCVSHEAVTEGNILK